MRKRIHAVHTTLKRQKTYQSAQTAQSRVCRTEFVQTADNIKVRRLQLVLKIGVDLMGNDNDPHALLEALKRLSLPKNTQLVAFGTPEFKDAAGPISFVSVKEYIGMDETPLYALRKKKGASIPVGLRMVKEGQLDAFVSAGNTGALVSSAKMILSTMKGILRPCLLTLMPTKKNPVAVLDVGANVQAKGKHLIQFAALGAAFQKVRGIQEPRVGLLNIGSEAVKGTTELREAYDKLIDSKTFSFVGNIEGKSVFDGDADVIVTDGFTGNIFLKTAEGIASLILDKIGATPPDVKKFQSLHYAEYPGAILAGVKGIVIKCHGYSTLKGFTNAVLGAIDLAKEGFVQKLLNTL